MSSRAKGVLFRSLVATAIAWGGSAAFAQNILTNGNFEEGFFNGVGGVMALGNNSFDIEDWQVLGGKSGGIDWITPINDTGLLPSDGLNFLNLVGTTAGADGAGVQLALPLAVVPGQYYELSFNLGTTAADHWLYQNPAGLPGPGVRLTISGTSSGGASPSGFFFFGNTSLPNNNGNNRWTAETTGPFQATGDWLSLAFTSVGVGGETFIGLEDVSVTALPEPSATALLALGALLWRTAYRRPSSTHTASRTAR